MAVVVASWCASFYPHGTRANRARALRWVEAFKGNYWEIHRADVACITETNCGLNWVRLVCRRSFQSWQKACIQSSLFEIDNRKKDMSTKLWYSTLSRAIISVAVSKIIEIRIRIHAGEIPILSNIIFGSDRFQLRWTAVRRGLPLWASWALLFWSVAVKCAWSMPFVAKGCFIIILNSFVSFSV